MVGMTVGIMGALLLGTPEGKSLVKKVLDALPEGLLKTPEQRAAESVPDFTPPLSVPLETPHSYVAQAPKNPFHEAPPPVAPVVSARPDFLSHDL